MSARGEQQFLLSATRRWVNFVLGSVLLLPATGTLAVVVASFGLHPITGYLIAVAALVAVMLPTVVLSRPVNWRPVRKLFLLGIIPFNLLVLSWVIFLTFTQSRRNADEAGLLELANVLLLLAAVPAALSGTPRRT